MCLFSHDITEIRLERTWNIAKEFNKTRMKHTYFINKIYEGTNELSPPFYWILIASVGFRTLSESPWNVAQGLQLKMLTWLFLCLLTESPCIAAKASKHLAFPVVFWRLEKECILSVAPQNRVKIHYWCKQYFPRLESLIAFRLLILYLQ